jgi:hypothetical protein
VKWAGGIDDARPDPRDVGLYQRARICQRFPAYTLRGLRDEPAGEIMRAIELIALADKAAS